MVMKVKTGTIANLVDDLCNELDQFYKPLLNAKWQSTQFELLKKDPPKDWVLLCMDYAENYNCHFQDEAQSAHWSYNHATIHPVVAHYRCQECNAPMHESVMIVSNDTKHNYHAVQHFVRITNEHLIHQGISIAKQIHFSDGSPCQYKSKVNFADASHGQVDFGFPIEKHFFGRKTSNGKAHNEAWLRTEVVMAERSVFSAAFPLASLRSVSREVTVEKWGYVSGSEMHCSLSSMPWRSLDPCRAARCTARYLQCHGGRPI